MPEPQPLILDLVVLIGAAVVGGALASLLRLPTIVGFLIAGVVVENYLPGGDLDLVRVQDIADVGVALLLFTVGVQLSISQLKDMRRLAIIGGISQIIMTIALGLGIGALLGLDWLAGLLLGSAIALTSTMVLLKLLESRGELESLHGRGAIAISLVQDIAVVPLVILFPAVAEGGMASLPLDLTVAALKAAGLLVVAYVLGALILPRLLFSLATTGSREILMLAVLALALGLAAASSAIGLSLAFGAFLAGLAVSESIFSRQMLSDVLPLRDAFATVFFVSMGMLIDPAIILDQAHWIILITGAIIFGKFVLSSIPAIALGLPARSALIMGILLAQSGEFSFVLASLGAEEQILSPDAASALLMGIMLSILINPLLVQAGPRLIDISGLDLHLARLSGSASAASPPVPAALSGHVVICGYGRIGRVLAREMRDRATPVLVIENNPYLLDDLRRDDIPHVFGDASSPTVLTSAALPLARSIAITVPNPVEATAIVQRARASNPSLDIVVRARGDEDYEKLLQAGATEVVHPEFEAGLEMLGHILQTFGADVAQVQQAIEYRRRRGYWWR